MKSVVTFGEIMLRLSTPDHRRFEQTERFDVHFGGGEANVAASLAGFGVPAEFVTRLPANPLGHAVRARLAASGVGTRFIAAGGRRLGIYFTETGASVRPSQVLYDREGSAMSEIRPGMIDWKAAFEDAGWFHFTGITPALSRSAADACAEAVEAARAAGLTVSCDLNYRKKLWNYGASAGEVMGPLVAGCDVVIGNEEDAAQVFGIEAPGADVEAGQVEADSYRRVVSELCERFPACRLVAVTLRQSFSASHNGWSALLWDRERLFTTRTYDIRPIVDRIGAGDAFAAALIHGLLGEAPDLQDALDFATAAACLKHSIPGDFNRVSVEEVRRLAGGDASGRVSR